VFVDQKNKMLHQTEMHESWLTGVDHPRSQGKGMHVETKTLAHDQVGLVLHSKGTQARANAERVRVISHGGKQVKTTAHCRSISDHAEQQTVGHSSDVVSNSEDRKHGHQSPEYQTEPIGQYTWFVFTCNELSPTN
jgi:hypothetical protein